jgi:SAM-dependent methyltransferase
MRHVDIHSETWLDFSNRLLDCHEVYAPNDGALALRGDVEARRTIEVFDYGQQADTFTRAFGMRNALKCFAALEGAGIAAGEYLEVHDLGCGSGAFSLAFASLANNPQLCLLGMDSSDNQIGIARRLFEIARVEGTVSFSRHDLPSAPTASPDLTLSSFWFCENRHAYRDQNLFDFMVGREMVVVDYPQVIDEIMSSLSESKFLVSKNCVELEIPTTLATVVGQRQTMAHSLHIRRTVGLPTANL